MEFKTSSASCFSPSVKNKVKFEKFPMIISYAIPSISSTPLFSSFIPFSLAVVTAVPSFDAAAAELRSSDFNDDDNPPAPAPVPPPLVYR